MTAYCEPNPTLDGGDAVFDGGPPAASRPSPLKAVRMHCLDCCNGLSAEVALCTARCCSMWLFRFGRKPDAAAVAAVTEVETQPAEAHQAQSELAGLAGPGLKAIKRRCLDCSGAVRADVVACKETACSLHPYRLGKNANCARDLSPEQRVELAKRLQAQRTKIEATVENPQPNVELAGKCNAA
jgi:hypothetical protein